MAGLREELKDLIALETALLEPSHLEGRAGALCADMRSLAAMMRAVAGADSSPERLGASAAARGVLSAAAAEELLERHDDATTDEARAAVARRLGAAWRASWCVACMQRVDAESAEVEEAYLDEFGEELPAEQQQRRPPLRPRPRAPPPPDPYDADAADALDAESVALRRRVADAKAAISAVEDTFGAHFHSGEDERIEAREQLAAIQAFVPQLEQALRGVLGLPALLLLARRKPVTSYAPVGRPERAATHIQALVRGRAARAKRLGKKVGLTSPYLRAVAARQR